MEKASVPVTQYPQSPETAHQQQPPIYQDPNMHTPPPQGQMYQQPLPQQQWPQQMQSPPPQAGYMSPQPQMVQQQQQQQQQHPGMGAPQFSGQQYHTVTPIPALGRGPAPVDCPACGQRALTTIQYKVGNATHAWALGLFCFTLCLCPIPYLMNSLKDVEHKCGRCGVLLATWHRSGSTEVHLHG